MLIVDFVICNFGSFLILNSKIKYWIPGVPRTTQNIVALLCSVFCVDFTFSNKYWIPDNPFKRKGFGDDTEYSYEYIRYSVSILNSNYSEKVLTNLCLFPNNLLYFPYV